MAQTVQMLNRFLGKAEIEIDSQRVVGVSYKRVFNKSWNKGGRWYHQAQTMPKGERQGITINGERVVEKDFSALHICLAYAKAGLNPPRSDPYAIDGFDRSAVKLASLVTLNGGTAAGIRKKFLDAGMVDLARISHTLTVRPPVARLFASRVAVTARVQARERPIEGRRVRFCERSGALRGQAALFGHETASRERERDRISRATVAWRISRGRVWPEPGAMRSGTDDCWPC